MEGRKIIIGSENRVREGIEKSIKAAIPSIKKIILSNHGIGNYPLWEK